MLNNSIECTDSHRVKMLPKVTVFDYKESEVCVFKLNYMNYSKKPKISKLLYWDLDAFTNNAYPDQTAPMEQSDLGLHCLSFSRLLYGLYLSGWLWTSPLQNTLKYFRKVFHTL